ncbi:MAG: PAS domain-containing protein [Elusimicrobia bacterium]|nr:PAS domain-containing protein [Elusimicrobiota bacterium]
MLEWNDEAERLFGWPRRDLLGRDFIETLVEPANRASFIKDLQDAAAAGGCPVVGRQWETPLTTPTGEVVRARWAVSPRPPWRSAVVFHVDRSVRSSDGGACVATR